MNAKPSRFKLIIMKKIAEEKRKQSEYKVNIFLVHYFKWLVLGAVVIIWAGSFFLVIQPKYKRINVDIKMVGEDKKMELAEKERELNKLIGLEEAYKEVEKENINKIKMMLSDEGKENNLMSQLESLVSKNGLLLSSLQIEKAAAESARSAGGGESGKAESGLLREIGKVRIKMDLVGTDYVGLKNIIAALENNIRLIDIVKLNFFPEEGKTSLEAVAYYFKK